MTSPDKVGGLAIALTVLLAIAIFADALLASAAWHPPPRARPPARAPAPAPAPAPALPRAPTLAPALPLAPTPAPTPRVLHVRSGEIETHGITRQATRRVFRRATPALERCYRDARMARPSLEGRITVHIGIDPDRVNTELMTTTTGDDSPLEQCVIDTLARSDWPFLRADADIVLAIILDTTAD